MDSNEHFAVRFWTLTDMDLGLALAMLWRVGGATMTSAKSVRENLFRLPCGGICRTSALFNWLACRP